MLQKHVAGSVVLSRGVRCDDHSPHHCHPPFCSWGLCATCAGRANSFWVTSRGLEGSVLICFFPLVQLPWEKPAHGMVVYAWLAPARVVKQEKQKGKTCKQIQQSVTKDLSGLEAVKTSQYLAWLKDFSEGWLLKHKFLIIMRNILIKMFWRS